MVAKIINGNTLAASIEAEVREAVSGLSVPPSLVFIMVGDDHATEIYVRKKREACGRVGISSDVRRFPSDISQPALIQEVRKACSEDVTGVIVQLPLPPRISTAAVCSVINPLKDVDCMTPHNNGLLFYSSSFMPCTVAGIMKLLAETGPVAGKSVAVINRSHIGKSLSLVLSSMKASVTLLGRNSDLGVLKSADIIISAAGSAGLVKKSMVKPGAVVIDVGISRVGSQILGDVDPAVAEVASFVTPVPGGVGPMTVAMLMKNALELAKKTSPDELSPEGRRSVGNSHSMEK